MLFAPQMKLTEWLGLKLINEVTHLSLFPIGMYCSWNTKSGGLTVVGVESEMVQNLIYESIVWNELMSTFFRLHGYYMLVPENNEI